MLLANGIAAVVLVLGTLYGQVSLLAILVFPFTGGSYIWCDQMCSVISFLKMGVKPGNRNRTSESGRTSLTGVS